MGNTRSSWGWSPDLPPPEPEHEPKFDPLIGFPNGRKERVVKATLEDMESAAIPPERRDYCVDKYITFLICKRKYFPLVYKCKHEVHDYHDCQFEDYVLRMKEFEREKRLSKIAAMKNEEME